MAGATAKNEDGLGGGPDTGASLMWLVSPGPEKVFAQEAHRKWVQPTPTNICQALFCCMSLSATAYAVSRTEQGELGLARLFFLASCSLCLLARTIVYCLIQWEWYLFDWCIVTNFVFAAMLWNPAGVFTPASSASIFLMVNTLTAFSLILQTKLLFHHWEAMSAFFLHVATPWMLFSLQASGSFVPTPEMTMLGLLGSFATELYLPWALLYLGASVIRDFVDLPFGLSKHPYLCQDIVGQVLGRVPPTVLEKVAFIICHAAMSCLGALMGCWSFFNPTVHMVWLLVSTSTSLWFGFAWYRKCMAKSREA